MGIRTLCRPSHGRRLLAVILAAQLFTGACVAESLPANPAARLEAVQAPLADLPITARVTVPAGPGWLGVGYGSVWLSKSQSKAVYRIDPATNAVTATIAVGSDAELGVGIGFGSVWIADPADHSLTKIDPKTNRVVRTFPIGVADDPEGPIGVGLGSVWILTNEGGTDSGTLSRVDPDSGRVIKNIKVGAQSHAAQVAFGFVWVTSSGENKVLKVDPRTNKVVAQIPVHASPRFMTAGFDSLWVMSQADGTLARIDPRTNRVISTIEVGVPGPGGDLDAGGGYIWVSAEGTPLSQVDPKTNTVVRQVVGGKLLDTLRVGFGSLWLVDESAGVVLRVSADPPRVRSL